MSCHSACKQQPQSPAAINVKLSKPVTAKTINCAVRTDCLRAAATRNSGLRQQLPKKTASITGDEVQHMNKAPIPTPFCQKAHKVMSHDMCSKSIMMQWCVAFPN